MKSLPGLRVLEIGESLSGAYCGLALSGQGADVVQIRTGLNRRLDEYESAFYDRGRILVADDAEDEAADEPKLLTLAAQADILLTDLTPRRLRQLGLPTSENELAALKADLVQIAITPFGLTGPHADYEMTDITEWAAGGIAFVSRRPVDAHDERFSPVLPPARQPELLAGIAAVIATLAGLRLVRSTGRAVLADVSRQEVQAAMSHQAFPNFVWNGLVQGGPSMPLTGIGSFVESADGMAYFRAVEEHQFLRLADWIGIDPELASQRIDGVLMHHREPDVVAAFLAAFAAQHTSTYLQDEGQRRRLPVVVGNTLDEILALEQLAGRNFWRDGRIGDATYTAPSVPFIEPDDRAVSSPVPLADLTARWSV